MNNLEEQTDGEAMIHSITHGEHPLPVVTQVSLDKTAPNAPPILKDPKFNDTAQELWDALGWQMRGYEYDEQDRQTKNLININIDALYNILKQNQGDVNDALGRIKKKAIVVTSDPLALVVEKIKVSKGREKVIVHAESEENDDEDISDLKNITALLAKAINRKKYYVKPTNNNLRTYSASRHFAKDCKKAKVKDYNYYKTKMLLAKKYNDEQVLRVEDQAWMESSSDSYQELSVNMVFKAKIENILSDLKESSSSTEETIVKVSYYTSDSESEYESKTSYSSDKSTNYGLFVDNDDDQETFHDAIESASENFDENHIVSQKYHDESEVDHNDLEEKDHLVNKLIVKFNRKIAKCHKHIKKANKQNTYVENQNKDLQDKNDVLNNQVNTFEDKSNELDKKIKVSKEKNDDLLAQTKILQEQLKVKHVVIDTHTNCEARYAKLKEERYQYMIKYYALCDNDKQHRKKIDEPEILFYKMSF
nr:RNA-directed DNA polymerase, eukaryota [Tanacetum cinerariifolium]